MFGINATSDISQTLYVRCGYTGHFFSGKLLFSGVTDVSRGNFPVLNIHGYVKKACKMGLTHLRDSRCVPIVLIKTVIVLLNKHVFKRFPFSIRDQGKINVYLS